MKSSKLLVIIFICWTLQSFSLHGKPLLDYDGDKIMTPKLTANSDLTDYLRYALTTNAGLKSYFDNWKSAVEVISQVGVLDDPKIKFSYFIDEIETRVGPQNQIIMVSQAFPWFGVLGLKENIETSKSKIAKYQYLDQVLTVIKQVKMAYFDLYYLEQSIRVTQDNISIMKNLERVLLVNYKSGTTAHSSLIRFQIEVVKIEDRLITLKDIKAINIGKFNALLNRGSEEPVVFIDELPQNENDFYEKIDMVSIYNQNIKLHIIKENIEKGNIEIDLAKKKFYPSFTLGATYIDTEKGDMDIDDNGKDPLAVSFSMTIPLWKNKYHAGKRAAQFKKSAHIYSQTEYKNILNFEFKKNSYELKDAVRKISLYENTLLSKANESLNVTISNFKSGEEGYLDLINSFQTILNFKLLYENAKVNRAKHLASLDYLSGVLKLK